VVSQSSFNIAGLMETAFHQCLYPRLAGGAPNRGLERGDLLFEIDPADYHAAVEQAASVSPTIDWVRLPQRFPVRIQVDSSARAELRIGQTASVAISHGARIENARIPE
jgi:multidrug resistance efflux pump